MSKARMLLAAALVAVPVVALATTAARAESWQDRGHSRPVAGLEQSGGHRLNSHDGYQVNRAHDQDRRHDVRRHHRPLFGFVPHRRYHNSH